MAPSSPPMGSDTSAGRPIRDAQTLEMLFRERFGELTDEARQQLDAAAASAPRVVELAFRHAWEARERLNTRADVETFLHEDVRHGATREISRRASLHRYDASGHGGTAHAPPPAPDVDQSWSHVAHALHFVDDASAAQESANVVRRDTVGHVKDLARRPAWKLPLALGVAAVAIIIASVMFVERLGRNEDAIQRALTAPDVTVHTGATGSLTTVNLDDGSRAVLTPESRLVVPRAFGAPIRTLRLEGSARFQVAAGVAVPFEVRALGARVTATGTAFVVSTLSADSTVIVKVTEGSVLAGVGDSLAILGTGGTTAIPRAGPTRGPTISELAEATTWNDHQLTVVDRPLREVLPQLKRWFGLDVRVSEPALLDRHVSFTVPLDLPRAAIAAVERGADVRFVNDGGTMTFKDARAGGAGSVSAAPLRSTGRPR